MLILHPIMLLSVEKSRVSTQIGLSLSSRLPIFLIYEISMSARTALGTNQRSLCYFVTSKEAGDAKYVEKSMAGKVVYL